MNTELFDYTQYIQAAREGDINAFNVIYRETFSMFRHIVFQYFKKQEDIEDVLQNVYLTIFQKLDTLQSPQLFMSWGIQICKRCAIDEFRRQNAKKNQYILMPESSDDESVQSLDSFEVSSYITEYNPEARMESQEVIRLVSEILDGLPQMQRVCIIMWKDEKSLAEIAEELSIPVNTVKTHIHRAKKSIKIKVMDLEKQGTKLYGMAPIPFFIWLMRVYTKSVLPQTVSFSPELFSKIIKQLPHGIEKTTSGVVVKTGIVSGVKGISIKIVTSVTLMAISLGGVAAYHHYNDTKENIEIVEESSIEEDIAVEIEQEKQIEAEENVAQNAYEAYELLMNQGVTESGLEIHYYAYLDLNQDEIPELLVSDKAGTEDEWSSGEVYTYKENQVVLCGSLGAWHEAFYLVNNQFVEGLHRLGREYVGIEDCFGIYAKNEAYLSRNEESEPIDEKTFDYYFLTPEEAVELGEETFIKSMEVIELQSITNNEEEGTEEYILCQTSKFEMKLPLSWQNHYILEEYENGNISLYNKENYEAFGGGLLVSIVSYLDSEEINYLPAYDLLEEKNGCYYVAIYPTDVQFEPNSQMLADIYNNQYNDLSDVLDTLIIY